MKSRIHNLKIQKERRRELRSRMTKAEIIFWSRIKNKQLGYKFRRQHSIGKYIVDFYCSELNLIIEIDGGIHFISENIEKDKSREEYFKKLGFEIIRYTNLDILNNLNQVLFDLKNRAICLR